MTIWFDMDGTIADLYAVPNWLAASRAENESPYVQAGTMLNMSQLAKLLRRVQAAGFQIGIISWASKNATAEYFQKIEAAKLGWLKRHLKSVSWDKIIIAPYGTDKKLYANDDIDILFDDDVWNRAQWGENAYSPDEIVSILKILIGE